MSRVLIVGPKDELPRVIETLYPLKLVHIEDHADGEDGLAIGKPLPRASEASEVLVKLRSISSVLEIPEVKAEAMPPGAPSDVRDRVLALEMNITEEDAARKKTQGLIAELSHRIDELAPFAELPLRLQDYRGYESIEPIVGKTTREITDLDTVTTEYEAFRAPDLLAVFVSKEYAARMRDHLARAGFTPLTIPEGDGSPRDLLAQVRADKGRWEQRLAEIERRLVTLRGRYADFLTQAKLHLEVEVEKAEAPLRFAVTDHSFVIDGWSPTEDVSHLRNGLQGMPSVYFSNMETAEHAASPPTLLKNVRPFRPFEMLVRLFSIPSYREIDPTFVVALAFPLFFGIMIGDVGYGAVWLVLGIVLLRRFRAPGALRNLIIALTWGGFFSLLFGLFFFADAFAIPFHAPEGATGAEAVSWSTILGIDIPIHATIEKLHQVADFIVFSIAVAYLHLSVAFGIGLFNEIGHNRKHAIGKAAWLIVLFALFVLIIVRAARWPGLGQWIWEVPLGWFPRAGFELPSLGFDSQNQVPYLAVFLGIAGLALLIIFEGGMAIMETFGLLANLISYGRLAAVGVAKAAMGFAFNVIAFESMIFVWQETGSFLYLAAGLATLFVLYTILFLLGGLTSAIQAVRLNYVEFFTKFFEGAGTAFRPFGMRATSEV